MQKKRKYNLLANKLKRIYKYNVNIVPIVFSWDGLVTRYFKKYTESIELDDNTIGYMQGNVIKDTLEIITRTDH